MADISKIQIESGTYDIKDEIARRGKLATYSTIDDLKNASNLELNSYVMTTGYYSDNDGRGSIWKIESADNQDVNNYDTVILGGGLKATRINNYAGMSTGELYGIRNTACISNINNTGNPAEVMGFENESHVATYENRDHVIQYKEYRGVIPNVYTITGVTATTVTLNNTPNNVHIGSIVDLYADSNYDKNNKYTGFVTDINDNVITVNNWYHTGNTATGQIPSGMTLACIDMPTKAWVNNDNLLLNNGTNVKEGVIAEYGLFGSNGHDASGIDIVNMSGNNTFGIQNRSASTDLTSNNVLTYGVINWNLLTSMLNRNVERIMTNQNSSNQELSHMENDGGMYYTNIGTNPIIDMANNILKVNANGTIQRMSFNLSQRNDGGLIDSSNEPPFVILTGSNTYTLDNGAVGRVIMIYSMLALNNLVINGTTYGLTQGKTVTLVNIGGNQWCDINNVLF